MMPVSSYIFLRLRLAPGVLFKALAVQGMIGLMITGAALANDNYAQEVLDRKVSISLKQVTLEKALAGIETVTHIKFAYSRNRMPLHESVSVEATDKKLDDVLRDLLTPHGITYKVHEEKSTHIIVLTLPAKAQQQGSIQRPATGEAQQRVAVTGTVTDAATHEPLPGVTVMVKGTGVGVISDAEGRYSIDAANGSILVFSFIGYRPHEVTVGAQTKIDVALQSDEKELAVVVVNAGYYDVIDREKTESISRVTSDVIQKQPVTNPLGALHGRMPGVYIQQTMGVPGGDFNIEIRGRNSLRTDGNAPLYVIDGVPFSMDKVSSRTNAAGILSSGMSPLTSINPNDIESIEVLKDAGATAIYGSRGANGVVLITTKKGKTGKTKFDMNIYTGAGKVPLVDMLNTQQYLAMRREAFANDGVTDVTDYPADAYDINGVWDTTRYTNWQRALIGGAAQTTSIQSSLSGGSDNTQFLFSIGYRKEGSVFPGDFFYRKGSAHLSVSHRSADKKFTMNVSVSGAMDKNNQVAEDLALEAKRHPPTAPALYDSNGNLNWENSTWENPLAFYVGRTYNALVNNVIGNIVLGYEILPGLKLKVNTGLTAIQSTERNEIPSTIWNPALGYTSVRSSVTRSSGNNSSWIVEPQAVWDKAIAKGQLSVLLGSTFQEQQFERSTTYYQNFPSNALMGDLSSAIVVIPGNYAQSIYRYAAAFGRINYNWDGKYIVNLTGRRDGSSRFGPGKQFANFMAGGLAWIFSNESFISQNLSFLSFGKLRGSYGVTGNDQIGNYQFLDTFSTGSSNTQYQGITGITPTRLFNPDFAWETNRKLETALELGFIEDRLLINIGWYRNRSSNQLVNYTLPATTGFNGILANLPATVQNTGIEIEVNTTNIERGGFNWTSSFNVTVPRNELIEFPNIESSSYASTYVVGQPIYIRMFYEYTGVDPETGFYTFRDYNEDGVFTDAADMKKVVFIGQHYFGGLSNTFTWKGWNLDVFLQFVKQTGHTDKYRMAAPGIATGSHLATLLDETRWQKPGDIADVQRFTTEYSPYINEFATAHLRYSQRSDAITGDASFIRLKNVSLSYQLPKRWTKGTTLRLYCQGQNLLVFTRLKAYDPESQSTRLAPLRMLTAGVQFTL